MDRWENTPKVPRAYAFARRLRDLLAACVEVEQRVLYLRLQALKHLWRPRG